MRAQDILGLISCVARPVASLVVGVLTGCVTVEVLCDNKAVSGNQVLTSRGAVADESVVTSKMEGGGDLDANVHIPLVRAAIVTKQPAKVRILCGNEILSNNQLGTSRGVTATDSRVKYDMAGGGKVGAAVQLEAVPGTTSEGGIVPQAGEE